MDLQMLFASQNLFCKKPPLLVLCGSGNTKPIHYSSGTQVGNVTKGRMRALTQGFNYLFLSPL